MTSRQLLPTLVLLSSLVATSVHAEDYVSAMTYVSLDVQGDDADGRDQSVSGGLGFGNHYWAKGSIGKLDNSDSSTIGDLSYTIAGIGARSEHWQLSATASRHRSDGAYRQQDINLTAEWTLERLTVGADYMHRSTENQYNAVRSFPRLNLSNVPLQIDQSLTGKGFGMHAQLSITYALSISLGGMSYNYDNSYTFSVPDYVRQQFNLQLISQIRNELPERFPGIANIRYQIRSNISRRLALLDSSFNAGMAYQFESAQIGIQYYLDKALETEEETKTLSLNASFFIGDHVMISPSVARSSTPNLDDVNMAGLSVSYNW